MKVKICGVRDVESAQTALAAGADFLGFNFVPTSKRYVEPSRAADIIASLSPTIQAVGIFRDETRVEIERIVKAVPLSFLQLHGAESPEFCASLPLPVIKALSLEKDASAEEVRAQIARYTSIHVFLLDRYKQGIGERLPLPLIAELARDAKIIVAGGITPENVREYASIPQLYGIDVAGGIETNGKPDREKIMRFVQEAKR